jgi:ferritin
MSLAQCSSITPLVLILARKRCPSCPHAPQGHFEVAEAAVKLSLEQEQRVTMQINALLSMAKAESDYTTDNFLQWFIEEQLEEVASMEQLLRVVQRPGEANLLRVEEYLAREKGRGVALSKEN